MNQSEHDNTDLVSSEPPRRSPWSKKERAIRMVWGVCELILWKPSPVWAWWVRSTMLRVFGARIGKRVRVHPGVKVIIPWNIELGDGVVVHDRAILYALGKITIGQETVIGPFVHICAGTHDYTDPAFTLLCQPITIGNRCMLGAASFVAPNVVLADRTALLARCAIYSDSEPGMCYQGNPARLYQQQGKPGDQV